MPLTRESFEGKKLREFAEGHQIPTEGLGDEELCDRCYESRREEDIMEALQYKHRCGRDQWSKEQWDETLKIVEHLFVFY